MPTQEKVLAICVSEPNVMYKSNAVGWFRNTIYSCRIDGNEFVIQSHGPVFEPTHWSELPPIPETS